MSASFGSLFYLSPSLFCLVYIIPIAPIAFHHRWLCLKAPPAHVQMGCSARQQAQPKPKVLITPCFGAYFTGAAICLQKASQLSLQSAQGFSFLTPCHHCLILPLYAFLRKIQKKAISPERGHFPSLECWTVFLYLDEARSDLDAHPSRNTPQKAWFLLLFLTRFTECWNFNIKRAMRRL